MVFYISIITSLVILSFLFCVDYHSASNKKATYHYSSLCVNPFVGDSMGNRYGRHILPFLSNNNSVSGIYLRRIRTRVWTTKLRS